MSDSPHATIPPATPATASEPAPAAGREPAVRPDAVATVEAELLIEDVSIDGMCGVY